MIDPPSASGPQRELPQPAFIAPTVAYIPPVTAAMNSLPSPRDLFVFRIGKLEFHLTWGWPR